MDFTKTKENPPSQPQVLHLHAHPRRVHHMTNCSTSDSNWVTEHSVTNPIPLHFTNMGCCCCCCFSSWSLLCQTLFLLNLAAYHLAHASSEEYISAIGDPGMKSPDVRVGLEAWNFCNEVGMEAPNMGSPRLADCADLCCPLIIGINICMLLYSFQW